MANEDKLLAIFDRLNRDAIDQICFHLAKIGELTPTDIHRIDQLQKVGTDVSFIENEVGKVLKLSEPELRKIFWEDAKYSYAEYRQVYEKLGIGYIPFEENKALQDLVESVSKTTYDQFVNITQTTGFAGVVIKDKSGYLRVFPTNKSQWQPLQMAYQNVVDYALMQIKTGQKDYYSALRSSIKEFSDVGLSYGVQRRTEIVDGNPIETTVVVEYPTKYKRRLDSSIANAINGGKQRLFREQMNIIGNEIGADGYEITAHNLCRESHLWFQGKQFTAKDYHNRVEPLLAEPNCHHRAFPIVLGISPATRTKQELAKMEQSEKAKHEYQSAKYPKRNGQKMTKYEASQIQRDMETAIRRQKDRAASFKRLGDTEGEKIAIAKATAKTAEYKEFSKVMGLNTYPKRITVVNFDRSQSAKLAWQTRKQK